LGLDLGATQHVIGNPNIISRFEFVVVAPMIAAGGEAHIVVGKGGVFVKFPNGEIKRIDGVFYIPSIKWNLLFVGCISDQGYIVKFIKSICIITDMQAHTIVGKGHRLERRGLYILQAESIANVEICNVEQSLNIEKTLLWHKKLGHISFQTFYELSKKDFSWVYQS
jgi:hypothetical protein